MARTRVVVPLLGVSAVEKPVADLNPVLRIDGCDCAFIAQSPATLTVANMGDRFARW